MDEQVLNILKDKRERRKKALELHIQGLTAHQISDQTNLMLSEIFEVVTDYKNAIELNPCGEMGLSDIDEDIILSMIAIYLKSIEYEIASRVGLTPAEIGKLVRRYCREND